jgi:hypothetical protein
MWTMGHHSPFDVLGVALDASAAELRAAYRRAIKAAHPDHGGDRERLELVLEAHRTLVEAGLLDRRRDPAPAPPHKRVPDSGRGQVYRSFLTELDRAAALVVRPRSGPRRVDADIVPPASAVAFAAVLAEVIDRGSAT